MRAPLREDVVD